MRPTIEPIIDTKPQTSSFNIYNEPVVSEPTIDTSINYENIEPAKVNVEADNIPVDKNIVSDDEFFDDFFGDD